jgi:broad specificity phosphatase PhoE
MFDTAPFKPTYTIHFLRHGESTGNAEGVYQGQGDYPLNATGRAQAQALAETWFAQGVKLDLVVSSPLLRARETAEIIAQRLSAPLELDEVWMERDNGKLSGMRPEEAAERYPRSSVITPYMPIGETGESQWDLYARAGRAVQSLVRRPPGAYLVVSHGGLLNMVMYNILGIQPQANFLGPRFRFRNTAYASLTYAPHEHAWRIEGVNQRQHWEDYGA